MPNHCANRLIITGDFKEREKFLSDIKTEDSEFDFNTIVKKPDDIDNYQRSGGILGGWYGWCIDHWGSKWGAYEIFTENDEDELEIMFQTAWNPPNDYFMKKLTGKYPKLHFRLTYAERGCQFYGYWEKKDDDIFNRTIMFRASDFLESEDEDECNTLLREELKEYEDLYNMSG